MKGTRHIHMTNLRSLPLCLLAGAFLCSAAALAQNAAPSVRIVSPIDESSLVTIRGTVHPLANARNDRGAAPDSLPLERMHLVLMRSSAQETALRQLITAMHTPGSASYHKWLTPAQFGAQFGASDQDIATVSNWLSSHGFNVLGVDPGKLTLEFSGTAGQFRSAFHSQVHRYSVNGETHFANSTDPQIPAALASVVGGFDSLNNFRIKRQSHYLGKASYNPSTGKAAPQWTIGNGTTSGDDFVMSPQDFYAQYDLNPLYTAQVNGSGQTIAIINDSNINVTLANQFRTLFGLPANPPQVIIDGNDPGVDGINNPDGPNYDSAEAYIDVEWSGAVAPQATIDLVIAADTDLEQGLILAAEHAVYGDIAPVISLSFGQCESALGSSTNAFLNALWEQAAAEGITVMVSSGDSGSAGCDDDDSQYYAVYGQAVNGFGSTPFNVSVGGTDFYYATGSSDLANYWNTTSTNSTPGISINTSKVPIPEQPWNDSQFGDNIYSVYTESGGTATSIAGGGGGASSLYAKPSWQSLSITGMPNDSHRDLPDVSLFAANGVNGSYYPVCAVDGDCQPVSSGGTVQISGYGGTSVSSPQFAAIMALVNQKYGPQGQADYVIYPLYQQYPAAFHDVTIGTNSVPCATGSTDCIAVSAPNDYTIDDPNYGSAVEGQIGASGTPEYNAGVGYDLATGLGSIDANVLVNDWNKITFGSSSVSLTVTPANSAPVTAIPGGASVTFSGTVTGSSPTGSVALMTDSPEPVNQSETFFTLSSGSYTGSLNYLPGGTYNVWVHYSGDANNGPSDSPKTLVTVQKESSEMFFYAVSPLGPISTNTTGIPYGTQLELDAEVVPESAYSTLSSCSYPNCPYYSVPTGTVTFSDSVSGSGLPNTASINAEGDAEFNAPFSVGTHTVSATYSGDNSYCAIPSTTPACPAASPAPSSITFQVVQDVPELNVNWPSGSLAAGSGKIIYGTGQPSVISFQLYNSNVFNYAGLNSGNGNYPVPVQPPTGNLYFTINGVAGYQNLAVPLAAAVDPSSGAPEGVATIVIPAGTITTPGNYSASVTYNGDTNYTAQSGSGTLPFVAATSTGLQSTIAATMTGSISPTGSITITGTVTGQGVTAPTSSESLGRGVIIYASGGNIPNNNYVGEVYFTSSSGDVSNFSTTFDSQNLPQGANVITLQYTGDAVYAPSAIVLNSGNPISNTLADFSMVPQTYLVPVTAGGSGSTNVYLSSVNGFTGTVNLTCSAVGVTCSFTGGGVGLSSGGYPTATLNVTAPADTANQTYNLLITGTDAATGKYVHTLQVQALVTGSAAGTQSFALNNSGSISIPILGNNGTSTITVTPLGGFTGSVGLACAITPVVTNGPTCTINAGTTAGSNTSTSVNITNLNAQLATLEVLSTNTTVGGVYTVTVTGTGTNSTPTNLTITNTVTANVGTPGLSIPTINPITVSTIGSTGSSTFSVNGVNGFSGNVNLTCTVISTPAGSGTNDPITCTLGAGSATGSSTSVSISAGGTATLTVYTTAATSLNRALPFFWPAGGGAVLAFLFGFFVPRRRRGWYSTMLILLALFVAPTFIACGSGGGSGGIPGGGSGSNPGTTLGAYTVQITASNTGNTISTTANVTVTVN